MEKHPSHFHLISRLTNYQEDVLNSWPISYRVLMCLSKLSWIVSILVSFEHSMQHIPILRHIILREKFFQYQLIAFMADQKLTFSLYSSSRLRFICYTTNITNWIYQRHFFLKGNISWNEWIFFCYLAHSFHLPFIFFIPKNIRKISPQYWQKIGCKE